VDADQPPDSVTADIEAGLSGLGLPACAVTKEARAYE
jgi:hypothetical protein